MAGSGAERLLPVSVVARRLGCSPVNVYRLIGRGDLACVRIGPCKGYRVPESAVEALIRARFQSENRKIFSIL